MRKLLDGILGDNPGGDNTPTSGGHSPTPDQGVNRPSAAADLRGRAIRLAGQVTAVAERFAALADESAELADAAKDEADIGAEPGAFSVQLGQARAVATFAEAVNGYFAARDDQFDIVVNDSLLVMACGASNEPPFAAADSREKRADTEPTADSGETTEFYVYHCTKSENPGRRPTLRVFDAEVKRSNEHAFSDYEDINKLGTVELPSDAPQAEPPPDVRVAVPLVPGDGRRAAAGPAPPAGDPDRVQEGRQLGALQPRAGGEDDGQGDAIGAGDDVPLGPVPAPAPAEGVVIRLAGGGFSPRTPAAARDARTLVPPTQ